MQMLYCGAIFADAVDQFVHAVFLQSGLALSRLVGFLCADVYPCRYFPNPVAPNTVCDKLPQGQCLSTGSCAWCQSAAVGSACYTQVLLLHTLWVAYVSRMQVDSS